MGIKVGDYLYAEGKFNDSLRKVKVESDTAKFLMLSNGAKVERNTLEYVPKKKAAEHMFTYKLPDEELDKRYRQKNMTRREKIVDWMVQFDAEKFFSSNSIALVFSIFLLLAQTFHTAHSLIELGAALGPAKYPFGILSGLFLDGLILFFLANGATRASWVSMVCCFLLNAYSYHLIWDWWTYDSWYALVPSIFVPYSLHAVGKVILKKSQDERK